MTASARPPGEDRFPIDANLTEFPFARSLSLAPLIAAWTQPGPTDPPVAASVGRLIEAEVARSPELLAPMADMSVIERHRELVDFLTRSPVFAMVVDGPADNTFSLVRTMVGATKVDDAQPGTIRGDFATITTENLVHASDSHESAGREIALWFPDRKV